MLLKIPRVSVAAADALLAKFGSLPRLTAASVDQLAAVELGKRKLGKCLAERIARALA